MEYLLCAPARARRSANKTWDMQGGRDKLKALSSEYQKFLAHERMIAGKLGPALEITLKVFALLAVGAVITSVVSYFLFDPLITKALFFGGLTVGVGAGVGLWRNEVRSRLAGERSLEILKSTPDQRTGLNWAMTNLQITEAEARALGCTEYTNVEKVANGVVTFATNFLGLFN